MRIRVGYELQYYFSQVTPVIMMLHIHYLRAVMRLSCVLWRYDVGGDRLAVHIDQHARLVQNRATHNWIRDPSGAKPSRLLIGAASTWLLPRPGANYFRSTICEATSLIVDHPGCRGVYSTADVPELVRNRAAL
jgi:hypothetical protein